MAKYICNVCGYVHEGTSAPAECPVCKAPSSQFTKKGVDVNNNVYIVTYSVIMVVIVAVLLALASLSLKSRQNANRLNEKKQQIVRALGEDPTKTPYESVISESLILDKDGVAKNGVSEDAVFASMNDLKTTFLQGQYPLFKSADGSVVIPLIGVGLWDKIWGYIALAPDMNTIKGIVLDHKGETPGLGAEIATPKHQAQYVGKQIFNDADFVSVVLVKGGANKNSKNYIHEVDAITGGTKTSNGVSDMIKDCLSYYVSFLKANMPKAEEVVNPENIVSNEQ